MGMDWLASCYANVDCRSKMVRFQFPGEPVLEWKGNITSSRGRFISYLKERKMIRKGYIYHLVRVQDVKAYSPTVQSIPVVNEFPHIFPDELPGLPLEWEIEFAIDTLPDTQPMSIPPYRMVPAELRELEEQLRNLLEKGFIRPNVGIRVDTQKIEAVKTWPRPMTPTEKATKFQWTDACERSFQALKDILTLTPVLTLLEGIDGYAIYCDTSDIGLGCVLMQHGKANVVADALSRRSMGSLSYLQPKKSDIAREIHHLANLGVRLLDSGDTGVTIQDTTTSSLVTEVKERHYEDPVLAHYRDRAPQKEKTPSEIIGYRVLIYRGPELAQQAVEKVKVLWRNKNVEEMTWEAEKDMKCRYRHLFPLPEEDRTETSHPLGTYMAVSGTVTEETAIISIDLWEFNMRGRMPLGRGEIVTLCASQSDV
ncbi:uncharacterized protein [Nicotiana tomentosiformis]|uniref:uncharacterized protein n=1 Tax=Nicotiana tomentosiformis TaxID=4098 RepID=UPI00388C783D